jgi:hypothetical protein
MKGDHMPTSRFRSWTGRSFALAVGTLAMLPASARAQTPLSFFPLTPCRLWDTRNPPGPSGGPKMPGNSNRDFPVRGICGVPSTAAAAVLNLTVTACTDFGNLRAYPAGTTPPNASVLNFLGDNVAIANGALVPLGTAGTNHIGIQLDMMPGSLGQCHVLCDVTGYFQ